MKQTNELTVLEIDQLKEITNIGAGNAATALSHMTGQRVEMSVPESFVGGMEVVQRRLGNVNDKVAAVFYKVHGDVEGAMVMILPPASLIALVELLTKERLSSINEVAPIHESSVKEMGSILLGASTTALSQFLGISMLHTIPDIAIDMLGSVMDTVLLEMGDVRGDILAFKVSMGVKETALNADFYYLFDPAASEKILACIGKRMKK